jgi:hypothetical protein
MELTTPNVPSESATRKKAISDQLTLWIGILGSLVTITLTVWNAHTKNEIDAIDIRLKERTTSLEESRARIEVYKWVQTLLPNLDDKDPTRKILTVNMVNLALSKDDAKKLFAGLQASDNADLRLAGQNGLAAIQTEPVAALVQQLIAGEKSVRLQAANVLERDYTSSPVAISLVLHLYDEDKIKSLSADGLINGLYYLNRTDPAAWNRSLVELGSSVIARIERQEIGNKTRTELTTFGGLLKTAAAGQ